MRPVLRRIVDIALVAAAAALLVLLAVPRREPPLPDAGGGGVPAPAVRASAQPEGGTDVPPETILRLFTGGAPAAAAAAPALPEAAPVDAPWLRYMGRSSDPDGTAHVYVKDTKSGKVIRATRGQVLDGWILVAEDAERLTLANGDELYAVSKR